MHFILLEYAPTFVPPQNGCSIVQGLENIKYSCLLFPAMMCIETDCNDDLPGLFIER